MLYKFLFPVYQSLGVSFILFLARVGFGTMFLTHGLQKMANFSALSNSFPGVMGMGSKLSLCMAIFAEVFCTLGFITGFLYRLSMIPMIVTMIVAVFTIHANDPLATKELAILYLMIFIIMYIAGPGAIAVDYYFVKR